MESPERGTSEDLEWIARPEADQLTNPIHLNELIHSVCQWGASGARPIDKLNLILDQSLIAS